MACPFFDPAEPFSWRAWPDPPRMPLGDPYHGTCAVQDGAVPDERLRTCCNTGYARLACPNFPRPDSPDTGAPDAVRFGIVRREAGVTTVRYVIERNHHPFSDGAVQLTDTSRADGSPLLERQARAFLNSYLRRAGETL